jgi:hypothetical protein
MFRTIISLIIYPLGVTTFVLSSSVYLFLALFIAPQKLYLLAKLISRAFLLSCGQWVTYDGVTPPKEGGPYLYMTDFYWWAHFVIMLRAWVPKNNSHGLFGDG